MHRLLAVAIGADSTYPELLDKLRVQNLCNNLNYRHRMAQYAGRASVALFTQIYFRDKKVSEDGYILFVRENALQVLLPKYGMECTLYVKDKPGGQQRIKVGSRKTDAGGKTFERASSDIARLVNEDDI